jgi:hypothetical protein
METMEMFGRPVRSLILLTGALLAGCAWQGPALDGHPGLQWQVQSFYGARAIEANAMCPQPQMTAITESKVVEESSQKVVMDLHYHFRDEGASIDQQGGSKPGCDGWGERRFTFGKTTAGTLEVESMTGPQRQT